MNIFKSLFFACFFSCSLVHTAVLPEWSIIPQKSTFTFSSIQNNAPVTGELQLQAGTLQGDLVNYQDSNIKILININSISVTYAELATLLITPEWLNIKSFPNAVFTSKKINKINNKDYR